MDYSINDRLLELRKKLGLSREAFGARIGVSRDVIKNFDYKLTTPKPLQIKLICEQYNVTEKWLTTGEGEMTEDLSFDAEAARCASEILSGGTTLEKCFIACLARTTPEQREVIAKIITDAVHLYDEQKAKEEEQNKIQEK